MTKLKSLSLILTISISSLFSLTTFAASTRHDRIQSLVTKAVTPQGFLQDAPLLEAFRNEFAEKDLASFNAVIGQMQNTPEILQTWPEFIAAYDILLSKQYASFYGPNSEMAPEFFAHQSFVTTLTKIYEIELAPSSIEVHQEYASSFLDFVSRGGIYGDTSAAFLDIFRKHPNWIRANIEDLVSLHYNQIKWIRTGQFPSHRAQGNWSVVDVKKEFLAEKYENWLIFFEEFPQFKAQVVATLFQDMIAHAADWRKALIEHPNLWRVFSGHNYLEEISKSAKLKGSFFTSFGEIREAKGFLKSLKNLGKVSSFQKMKNAVVQFQQWTYSKICNDEMSGEPSAFTD